MKTNQKTIWMARLSVLLILMIAVMSFAACHGQGGGDTSDPTAVITDHTTTENGTAGTGAGVPEDPESVTDDGDQSGKTSDKQDVAVQATAGNAAGTPSTARMTTTTTRRVADTTKVVAAATTARVAKTTTTRTPATTTTTTTKRATTTTTTTKRATTTTTTTKRVTTTTTTTKRATTTTTTTKRATTTTTTTKTTVGTTRSSKYDDNSGWGNIRP